MEQLGQVKDMTVAWYEGTKGTVDGYLGQSVVRTRSQVIITGMLLFTLGVLIGFLCSPIKKGITIASNNTDSFNNTEDDDE